jgi:5-methylcytosine-specific restriction protein A
MPRKPGEAAMRRRAQAAEHKRVRDHAKYDYFERNQESKAFYNSPAWRKCRDAYMARHPLCEDCASRGLTVRAREVHHITPIDQGGAPLDPENLQALCHQCHMQIHGFRGGGGTEVNVVYGPPAAGKTTWVESQCRPGDFVWDFDKVKAAVSGLPLHSETPAEILDAVLAMRDALVEMLKRNGCRLGRVWFIVTSPEKYRTQLHRATFYRVEADMETCLARARQAGRPQQVLDVIRGWYAANPIEPGDRRVGGELCL